MKVFETQISYGYKELIEVFAKANNLVFSYEERRIDALNRLYLTILVEENSETDLSITFMSVKHLGFENMLVDYLLRCGIEKPMIQVGSARQKRNMEELDRAWEVYRKETLGFR